MPAAEAGNERVFDLINVTADRRLQGLDLSSAILLFVLLHFEASH
jgi:hypothetical protein